MKKPLNLVIYITCILMSLIASSAVIAKHIELNDFRKSSKSLQLTRMQEYHLQNAQQKINKEQFAYAWGDLAYILCQIPNHHIALQEMLELAPRLHKEDELKRYFQKALTAFPDDKEVQQMYSQLSVITKK